MVTYVKNSRDPGEQRALNAIQVDSAVVAKPGSESGSAPAQRWTTCPRAGASLRYLPTGVTVVGLRPWSWESSSASLGVRLARAETIAGTPCSCSPP